jgi:N-acetylglucosaminyldiphosphoundecaprenol N-acetyl-beta-D-mannosaminyltransferase
MPDPVQLFGITFERSTLKVCADFIIHADKIPAKYVCLPDMYVISRAHQDPQLKKVLNSSFLTLPDGKPIQWAASLKGVKGVHTISGYWLIRELLKTNLAHYFYGGDPVELPQMINNIKLEFPDSNIVGYKAPPMLSDSQIVNNQDISQDISDMNKLKPDIVWVGISSPKQDMLVSYYHRNLEQGIMITVGGVFDYLLDPGKKSPEWIKRIGLRWLYRIFKEPRRLWPKYWYTVKIFSGILVKRFIP